MKLDLQRHGTVTVVVPQDAITEANAAELRTRLETEGLQTSARLVLDLSQVAYVDSAGIEFLLAFCGSSPPQAAARREAPPKRSGAAGMEGPKPAKPRDPGSGGLRPRLAGLTDTVREALYLTDTLKRFSVFESVPAAVRSYV